MFFFFFAKPSIVFHSNKKRSEKRGKSALQAWSNSTGRLSVRKDIKQWVLKASLAVQWAAELQAFLTQTKEIEQKALLKARISQTKLLMTQLGWRPGSESASKHSFASPSIMTFIHPSATTRLTAQSTAVALAWAGGHLQYGLIHVLMGVPEWSLASTASAVKVLLTAASTLSFMEPSGGGDQDRGCGRGERCSPTAEVENSNAL